MKAQKANQEIEQLIKARYPVIIVNTSEENRVEMAITEIASRLRNGRIERGTPTAEAGSVKVWTITRGLIPVDSNMDVSDDATVDPGAAIRKAIGETASNAVYILKDMAVYLSDNVIQRWVKDMAFAFQSSRKTAILIQPSVTIPAGLDKLVAVVDYPLPDGEELGELVDAFIERLPQGTRVNLNGAREEVIRALAGLTMFEGQAVLAKATVANRGLDTSAISEIVKEKAQIVKKAGVLEYFEASTKYDEVGGLDMLKSYARQREGAYSKKAQEFGIEAPKGLLMLGVPGCGKSLTAKAIAGGRRPLLRLDVGALMGSLVGQSEGNLRQALQVAEAVAPCVLWIDEMEKGLSGVASSGSTDGGTTARLFGSLLTWMEERKAPVYVVATANDPSALPPELFRRFDAVFFVDLPNQAERAQILSIHLAKRNRKPEGFNVDLVAKATESFTGSELETLVKGGLFRAFSEGRDLTTEDLVAEVGQTVPLATTMAEKLQALRAWAAQRARPSSSPLPVTAEAPKVARGTSEIEL